MVAFTTARGLYQVANSSFVGTWDVPENSNWDVVDSALGKITTIQLNNTPVTLTAAQVQDFQITFSSSAAPGGNLAGNVAVTFPLVSPSSTVLTGPYVIQNLCGNSSLFTVTLQTTVVGGQVVACKPGEPFDVINDGTNFKFKNLGHIGSYWDYAGSSVPNWVTACTVPPYLNCDGTAFSSATYPTLASILGTTLPDSRGRARFTLNQTTTRLNSTGGGLNGNTILSSGGVDSSLISSSNITAAALGGDNLAKFIGSVAVTGAAAINVYTDGGIASAFFGSTSPVALTNIPPAYVSGITMIRAG